MHMKRYYVVSSYVSCICVIVQLHFHCIYAKVKAFWAVLCIAALHIPDTV